MDQYITDAIVKHLSELRPDVPCYCDEYWQDDDGPAFFLNLFNVEQSPGLGNYFHEVYQYDLLFDPKPTGQPDETCREMAGFLRVNLRRIPEPEGAGTFFPYDIRSTMADGVLHVMFNVYRDYQVIEPESPEITDVSVTVKEKKCIQKEKY